MMACEWRSEDSFQELVLSFYRVDFWDQTQAIRLGNKDLYQLSHLTGPLYMSLIYKPTVSLLSTNMATPHPPRLS